MVESSLPRVTITIPTYNRANLLAEAIRSVLDQSMKEIEVFVSDNASTDDTAAVVASFEDRRLHYVRNDMNIGHLANLSRGLRLGSAPFLGILPDDDVMLPNNLERKVRLLEDHPEAGLAHSASRLVHMGPDGRVLETYPHLTGGDEDHIEARSEVLRRLLTDSYWINFPAALIRRSLVGGIAFDPKDRFADDLGMFLRIVRRAEAVAYVAEPLVALRMHSHTISAQAGFHESRAGVFRPTPLAFANIRDARKRFLRQYGHEFEDPAGIRSASRQWIQRSLLDLLELTKEDSRGQPGVVRLRPLVAAARVDPAILGGRKGVRLLAGALLGARGYAFARRFLGHRNRSRRSAASAGPGQAGNHERSDRSNQT